MALADVIHRQGTFLRQNTGHFCLCIGTMSRQSDYFDLFI